MLCQGICATIFIGIAFFSQRYILSWKDKDKRFWQKVFTLVPFVTAPIGLVFLLNVGFVLAKKYGVTVVSDLSYKDAMLLVASILGPVGIAYFQDRVRISVEVASAEELDNDKRRENRRREAEREWHEDERREEYLQSLAASIPSCSGYAVNYAIPGARIANAFQFDEERCYVLTVEAGTNDTCCFYYPHFSVLRDCKKVEIKLDGSEYTELQCGFWSLGPNFLQIQLNEQIFGERIHSFFLGPAVDWDISRARDQIQKLEIRTHLAIERQFEGYGAKDEQDQPKKDAVWLAYCIHFSVSTKSGYDAKGQFQLEVSDGYIDLEKGVERNRLKK